MEFEIDRYGTKRWYKDGERHRGDGPAIEWKTGTKWWYKDGKLHREDGPAIECSSGDKEWWINDKRVSEEEHKAHFEKIRELQHKYYYKWVEWHFDPNRKGSKVYQNLYKKLEAEVGEFLN